MEYTLKEARKKVGLSQQELADRMGVSRPRISELESKAMPSVATIFKLAEAIDMQVVIKPGQEGFWLIDPPVETRTEEELMAEFDYMPDAEEE